MILKVTVGSIVLIISRFQISIYGKKLPTIKKFPFFGFCSVDEIGFIFNYSRHKGN
jgi:hypothetical protein